VCVRYQLAIIANTARNPQPRPPPLPHPCANLTTAYDVARFYHTQPVTKINCPAHDAPVRRALVVPRGPAHQPPPAVKQCIGRVRQCCHHRRCRTSVHDNTILHQLLALRLAATCCTTRCDCDNTILHQLLALRPPYLAHRMLSPIGDNRGNGLGLAGAAHRRSRGSNGVSAARSLCGPRRPCRFDAHAGPAVRWASGGAADRHGHA